MKKHLLLFLFATFFLISKSVLAYQNPGNPTGFVNDYAGIFTPDQKTQLENKLTQFEQQTTSEVSVVTIKSLQGDTIENFAVKLFQDWGIGKKDKDNGVLLLVAIEDREVKIEVGYGLEGDLTDAQSYWIIQNEIIPKFKNNDYPGGISDGVEKIMGILSKTFVPPAQTTPEVNFSKDSITTIFFFGAIIFSWLASILGRSKSWWAGGIIGGIAGIVISIFFGLIFMGLILIIILFLLGLLFDYIVSKSYRNSLHNSSSIPWWAGGNNGFSSGGGGGFGGFGGGRSGGGGASGRW